MSIDQIDIVIPWRDPGDIHRRNNAEFVINWYREMNLGEVVVSSDGNDSGPFNRSAAYNNGYLKLSNPFTILWVEADTLLQESAIKSAASKCDLKGVGLVIPFTERHELNSQNTRAVLDGADPFRYTGSVVHGGGWSIGAAGVTTAEALLSVGGWHEGFAGWGYDDNAMFWLFRQLAGEPQWVESRSIHLWHPPAGGAGAKPDSQASEATERNRRKYEEIQMMTHTEAYKDVLRSNNGRII